MPNDVTNMPFPRTASYLNPVDFKGDPTLKVESILLEEFNYASSSAYQAMEDRARMFNFYLVLVGVFVSGLVALYQASSASKSVPLFLQPLVTALLFIVGILGFVFFLKLIRLRQASRESLITMNVIKEFYIQKFQADIPEIEHVFRWRLKSIPNGERFGSVTFLVCSTVAALGSLCLAGAAFVGDQLWLGNHPDSLPLPSDVRPYVLSVAVFVVSLLFHVTFYRRMLNKRKDLAVIAKQAAEIGITLPPSKG